MDPIAHTLFGATLAEAGLKKTTRYATAALLIGANLPDIDGLASFVGSDFALYWRRGWSHGLLAMIILPVLLWLALLAWHRWRHRQTGAAPLSVKWLLAVCVIGVWSHPLLDWLNTYGVRLLMPFDGRWFYGDTLFIIDPWFWLLAGAGVVVARTQRLPAKLLWTLLAILLSWLVLATSLVPLWVKLGWLAGIGLILLFRLLRLPAQPVAGGGLLVLLIYIGCLFGLGRLAEAELLARHPDAIAAQANPLPGTPLQRRLILISQDHFRVIRAGEADIVVARQEPDAVVRAAMADKSVQGFVNWMRYPYWHVLPDGENWRVNLRDLRYTNPGEDSPGIGSVWVTVTAQQVEEITTGQDNGE